MPIETINIAESVANKIKVRYAEITERTMGSANMVIDAFYPTYVRESLVGGARPRSLSKKCSAISPFLAQELGVFQIPFEDLAKMLGYKKQDLKILVESVKAKKLTLVLAGLGGTGMNFMHWASEICNFTNSVNIFEKIEIWDKDEVDLTNIFRFPQALNPQVAYASSENRPTKKTNLVNTNNVLSRLTISTYGYFITKENIGRNINKKFNDAGQIVDLPKPEYELLPENREKIYYGAPSIATREMFSEIPDLKFVSGTHGDDDCQLYIRPEQDSTIQIESYGMINLSIFFMNQIKLTISFLELLASDTDLLKSQLVMEYSFSEEYINDRVNKAGLNRTYNFPIMRNNVLDQEEGLPDQQEEVEPQTQEESSADAFNTIMPMPPIPQPVYPPQPPRPTWLEPTVPVANGTINPASEAAQPTLETTGPVRRPRRTRAEMEAARIAANEALEAANRAMDAATRAARTDRSAETSISDLV